MLYPAKNYIPQVHRPWYLWALWGMPVWFHHYLRVVTGYGVINMYPLNIGWNENKAWHLRWERYR